MTNDTKPPARSRDRDSTTRAETEQRVNVHDAFYGMLLDKVRADRYPSSKMLDILESTMIGYEREELAWVLLEKVSADRYPSIPLIERITRLTR